MSIDEFVRYSEVLHRLTTDFVRTVPEDKWHFTPDPPAKSGRAPAPYRIGDGFASFCKQLRHVVCVRGVYNAALATRKVDWTRKHEHYAGPLTREALLAALDDKQRQLRHTPNRQHRRADRLGRNPFHVCAVHLGVCPTRVDPSRSVEHLCLARRVRHSAQLANVVGLVTIDTIDPAHYAAADGDGQTRVACEAGIDVGRHARPGLPPGRYFRLLSIGYFEGLDAEWPTAWRC